MSLAVVVNTYNDQHLLKRLLGQIRLYCSCPIIVIASEYNKEQLLKAVKGVPKSEEAKRKISLAKSEPVKCVETGKIFQSSLEAADYFNVSGTAIRQAIKLKGRCCKYHWEKVSA